MLLGHSWARFSICQYMQMLVHGMLEIFDACGYSGSNILVTVIFVNAVSMTRGVVSGWTCASHSQCESGICCILICVRLKSY